MPFSSLLFVSAFLPLFLACYWSSPRAAKNTVALLFSIVFYAWGAPRLLPVVLALGVIDFYLGRWVGALRAADDPQKTRKAKIVLACGVVVHLSVLAYFKYSNFLVEQTNAVLAFLPGEHTKILWKEVPLPIGISFLTFEEISYLVDVYRGHARPARSVGRYLLFLMLFPHSIAGPIFRWKDLEAQLDSREHSFDLAAAGFSRFVFGLAKKVLIADAAATVVDPVFGAPAAALSPGFAWMAAIAYTIQIYFDFSGYSDMAIGLGQMAGFRFKENFDSPYRSASITEFWQRWHISLSTWLRDYLYIPLGGNRRGERRARINVFIVFALSGLWHGAAWTFVVWGVYHGAIVIAERTAFVKRIKQSLPRVVNVPVTMLLVVIGWVFFRAPSLEQAVNILGAMAFLRHATDVTTLLPSAVLSLRTAILLAYAILVVVFVASVSEETRRRLFDRLRPVGTALVPVAIVLVIAQLVNSRFNPIIYFKF